MDDLFKKFINTGVGFLSQGNKRVQAALDQLVKESKISEHEGKKIMDDLLKSGEAKRKTLEKQFSGLADTVRERVGLAPEPKAKPAPKTAAKPAPKAAAKPASSATAKAAGPVKKAAAKVSDAADTARRPAAAKAGAAKKKAAAAANDSKE